MSLPSLEKKILIHTTFLIVCIFIIHILYLVGKEKIVDKPCSDGLIQRIDNNDETFDNKKPKTTKIIPETTKIKIYEREKLRFYNCFPNNKPNSQKSKILDEKINNSFNNSYNSFIIAIVNIIIFFGLFGIIKNLFRNNNSFFGKNVFFKYLDISLYIKKFSDNIARLYNFKYLNTILTLIVFGGMITANIFYYKFSIIENDLLDELSVIMYAIYFTIVGLTSFFFLVTIPHILDKSNTTLVLSLVSFILLILSCVLQFYNIDMINNLRKGEYNCKINVDSNILDGVLKLANKCVMDNNNNQLLLGLNITLIIISGIFFIYLMYKLLS
tara:strand:- start:1231 stop:2214 length:984 start_codon:yes stop_codon:yes gene_type:complete